MSELVTLARPYASAVFKRAKATKSTKGWSESLAFIAAVLDDERISNIVGDPRVSKPQLQKLILGICQNQVHAEAVNLLKVLVENDRLSLANYIADLYERLKADEEGYVDAEVLTAFAFTTEEEKKFVVSLEKVLKKKVRVRTSVDKSLIGGFIVRAGDKVIDGSIKGQLQQLAKRL